MKIGKISLWFGVWVLFVTGQTSFGGELKVGGYTFAFGDKLALKDPPRPMTQGGVAIPAGEGGGSLDANFYYFGPGQGGGVDANVARWIGQFEGEPTVEKEESEHGDRKLVFLKAKGTYLDGSPFGPKTAKEGYALLGAIIEGGDAPVFVKLYGPEKEVAVVEEAFKALVLSAFGEK